MTNDCGECQNFTHEDITMLIYVIAQIDDSFSYRFLTTVFFAITWCMTDMVNDTCGGLLLTSEYRVLVTNTTGTVVCTTWKITSDDNYSASPLILIMFAPR